jgi:hypothetical protein
MKKLGIGDPMGAYIRLDLVGAGEEVISMALKLFYIQPKNFGQRSQE